MFNREKEIEEYSRNTTSRENVKKSIKKVLDYLKEQYKKNEIDYMQYSLLADMFRQVTENLAKDDEVREEVEEIMNGRIEFRGTPFYRDGIKAGLEQGRNEGIERGRSKGIEEGEARLAELIRTLVTEGKYDLIEKVSSDSKFREKMYDLYGIE